jgi:hypothetical protein
MRSITFQSIAEQPDEQSFHLFPDFLITRLIYEGRGRIEARYPSRESEFVPFIFKTRDGQTEKIIGEIGRGFFRSVLAQLAVRCHIENIYAGHTFFSCDAETSGQTKTHRFSLFICNEPTMDFWLILYHYSIDIQNES